MLFLANGKLLAQEENYQSIKVTDTLNEVRDRYDERKEERAEIKKLSKQKKKAHVRQWKKERNAESFQNWHQ